MATNAAPIENSCDCHVHVFEAPELHPFAEDRPYTPGLATLEDMLRMHAEIGVTRSVIVQATPHGHDNQCLLASLDRLEGRGRGVVVVDDNVSAAGLKQMHARGVRGVRLNIETKGGADVEEIGASLQRLAAKVADLGWHVQIFTNLTVLRRLMDVIARLPVPLVVDHFGRPKAEEGVEQPGFADLCDALAGGHIYVKLSAPYRISQRADYSDVAPLATALISANPDRVLWGTDWPHSGSAAGPIRPPHEITPFRKEDNKAAYARAASWASDDKTRAKLFALNAAKLYGF